VLGALVLGFLLILVDEWSIGLDTNPDAMFIIPLFLRSSSGYIRYRY